MGAPATRITAADFLTPPELRGHRLAADGAGRIGGARIELVGGPARTRLGFCYEQVPLRVLPPFQYGADEPSLLYLLNPTAGLLAGDAQLIEVTARAGTRTVVVGQSATRIHPCRDQFSTQQWRIHVEPGAILLLMPGPAIPFVECRYYQRVSIDAAPGAAVLWGDTWYAGRYARGEASEQFRFTTMVQHLEVRSDGRLVYRDRFCWQGPWDDDTAAWHFGDATACGSLLVVGPEAERRAPRLTDAGGVCFRTAAGHLCLRYQGTSEAVTGQVVQAALRGAACFADHKRDAPWLLDGHDLAPNHWFTLALTPV